MTTLTNYLIQTAEKFPARCAIESKNTSISYQDLLKKSLILANFLLNFDQTKNIIICLPKSISLYCSIFGVLFSGKCYVPLSYQTPSNRLKYIIKDSGSKLLITTVNMLLKHFFNDQIDKEQSKDKTVIAIINEEYKVEIISSIDEIFHNQTLQLLNNSISNDTPCYLLYTSGSTGKPKGILHTHKSASIFIDWAAMHLNLNHNDIVAHKSDVCFDLSTFDIFATIKVGAKLVPIPEIYFNNGMFLINFINKNKITILYSVPSTILNHLTTKNLSIIKSSMLRHIIFAGEQLYSQPLQLLFNNLPSQCQLHNWYGPTETNVCSYFIINEAALSSKPIIPIGYACGFSKLETNINNVLLIQTESLMFNYWNHEKMIDPYYSGDIVSQDKTGAYYFKGRTDRLIKFRGYRLQPEEIEEVINSFSGINESAVISNETDLIAFISSNEAYSNDFDLLIFCRNYLESYMLPTRIIELKKIPRSQREKVDYHALLQLELNNLC